MLRGQGKSVWMGSDQPSGSLDPDEHSGYLGMYCQFSVNHDSMGTLALPNRRRIAASVGKLTA